MLVLSRQVNQVIKIGDDIEIMIVDIRGDKCRIGINAPKETTVHRQEVYEAIQRENLRKESAGVVNGERRETPVEYPKPG